MQQQQPIQPHPKHTPDLVLDLPVTSHQRPQVKDVSPSDTAPDTTLEQESPPGLTTAEVFAKSDQSTIKKGQMPRSVSTATNFNTTTSYVKHVAPTGSIKRSQTSVLSPAKPSAGGSTGSQSTDNQPKVDPMITSAFNNNRPVQYTQSAVIQSGKPKLHHTISDSGSNPEDEKSRMSVAQKAATLERTGIGYGGVYPLLGRPSPSPSPEPPEKPPKPSLRPKPPVMRKPRSPDVWKKMKPGRDDSPPY